MAKTEQHSTGLLDFGSGILAGLIRGGIKEVDSRDVRALHAAFLEAFKVVEAKHRATEGYRLFFSIRLNRHWKTTGDVTTILNFWLFASSATLDAPGTMYRFSLDEDSATQRLEKITGGAELYDAAAKAFCESLQLDYRTPR